MKKMTNKKGFTLAELLIVVAIIAVLVAIAIPVFTSQLEKSREATDLANIRAAYAEVVVNAIDNDQSAWTKTVSLKQQQDSWQTSDAADNLKSITQDHATGNPKKDGTATITWVSGSGNVAGYASISLNG